MSQFKRIDPTTAQQLREQGANIVDIRDGQSYESSHIPGSTHLDRSTVQQFIQDSDHDKPLVVVCYHGNSSQSAAAWLAEQGFAEVYSLDGGFELWRARFPTETEQA